jgi:hypothetical protein
VTDHLVALELANPDVSLEDEQAVPVVAPLAKPAVISH